MNPNYFNLYSKVGHTHSNYAHKDHTHDFGNIDLSGYFPKTGGDITGDVRFPNNNSIKWERNTDFCRLYFKNNGDDDSDSYMCFEAGDNGNEFFKFVSKSTTSSTDLLTIKTDHLRFKGNAVYHAGNKPTWNDISGKPTIVSDGATLGRLTFTNWIYSTGNTGWLNSTYGGGWYMSDSTWMRVHNNKNIYNGTGTIYTEGTMKCHILDDNVGSSNSCYVDNANGGNSQITLRPDTDNRGNLGHKNYTWNYANITSVGNTFSLDREITYNVSEYVDNDSMYDMVKNMSFYLEQEKSVEEFQEEVELKQTEEYKNADKETQSQMLKAIEKSIPSTYYYSKRSKLVANAEELPFEVAPHSHVSDGSRTVEIGSFMVGLASALQKAIQKIEDLENKIEELEKEKGE